MSGTMGSLLDLGGSIGKVLLWAIIPGLVVRCAMGFLNRGKKKENPNSKAYKEKKAGVVTYLGFLYFAYKMYSVAVNQDENYYDVMGLEFPVSRPSKIKKAYRKLSLEAHPDKGGTEDMFNRIRDAYEILGDINYRRIYDRLGKAVFTCKECKGLTEYWLSMRMLDTALNYFMAIVFLVWATWSHDRAWIRPYMYCLLGATLLAELVFVFSDEAPDVAGRPPFEVVDILRQCFFTLLSTACIACNYWPSDPRTDREIIQNLERSLMQTQGTIHQMLVMNQVIGEDPQLKAKFEEGCRKRHAALRVIMSNPASASEFARLSSEAISSGKQPEYSSILDGSGEGSGDVAATTAAAIGSSTAATSSPSGRGSPSVNNKKKKRGRGNKKDN